MHVESTLFAVEEDFEKPFLVCSNEAGEPEPHSTRIRVLVVDDQRLIADTLSEILQNAGFEASAAYNGEEALDMVSKVSPDWVLSDVVMPKMNGVELGIAIRTQFPGTSILLFSGQAGISSILEDAQRRGHEFEILPKPIHPRQLIERMRDR